MVVRLAPQKVVLHLILISGSILKIAINKEVMTRKDMIKFAILNTALVI